MANFSNNSHYTLIKLWGPFRIIVNDTIRSGDLQPVFEGGNSRYNASARGTVAVQSRSSVYELVECESAARVG